MRHLKRTVHIFIASVLIVVGVCGLVLPILNGTIFLLLGFILISFESPYVEKKLEKLTHKSKFTKELHDKLHTWMRKIFK
jgi:uncharacterized membrane protein YbaN (DUF454 family)